MKSAIFIASLIFSLNTFAGPDVTGGGDVIVMKFRMAARDVCSYFKSSNTPGEFPFDVQKVCLAVEQVKIEARERLYLSDGTEVDALNTPATQTIQLSIKRNESKFDGDYFYLAFHELISVIGVDDRDYKVSGPLMLKVGSQEQSGDIVASSCENIVANNDKVRYRCEDDLNVGPFGIDLRLEKNQLLWPRFGYPAAPWDMNGLERQYSDTPGFLKATCLVGGFKMESRGDNYNNKGNFVSRSWSYEKYLLNADGSELRYYMKSTAVAPSGRVSNRELKTTCIRE